MDILTRQVVVSVDFPGLGSELGVEPCDVGDGFGMRVNVNNQLVDFSLDTEGIVRYVRHVLKNETLAGSLSARLGNNR